MFFSIIQQLKFVNFLGHSSKKKNLMNIMGKTNSVHLCRQKQSLTVNGSEMVARLAKSRCQNGSLILIVWNWNNYVHISKIKPDTKIV